jgi:hypothetical protein
MIPPTTMANAQHLTPMKLVMQLMLGKRIAMQLIMPENVALSIRVKVVLL